MKRSITPIFPLVVLALLILPGASALPTVTTAYSENWSGYVATAPSPYTSVSATWIVPSVSATSPPAYSAVWVGIGGVDRGSNRLIQAGTEQDVLSDGSTQYYAWHEVYPRPSVLVAYISAGDSIAVAISQVPTNASTWRILIARNSVTILDLTENVSADLASVATAEFIIERPSIEGSSANQTTLTTLADFGSVTFSGCKTNRGALALLTSAYRVIMTIDGTRSGQYLAQPGTIETASSGFGISYSATAVSEFPTSPLVLVLALTTSLLAIGVISRNWHTRR